jgi:hypothetical protein
MNPTLVLLVQGNRLLCGRPGCRQSIGSLDAGGRLQLDERRWRWDPGAQAWRQGRRVRSMPDPHQGPLGPIPLGPLTGLPKDDETVVCPRCGSPQRHVKT